jgi:hypothetical protein
LQAAAEALLCPLPNVSTQLSLPNAQQQRQVANNADTAPSMPRAMGQMLPLRKMPPAFVLILAPLAKFWGGGHTLPLEGNVAANSTDLQACEQMATAVLAAKRGGCDMFECALIVAALQRQQLCPPGQVPAHTGYAPLVQLMLQSGL